MSDRIEVHIYRPCDRRIEVHIYRPCDRRFLQLAWVDADGRRRFCSAKTEDEDEARRKANDLEYELNHGAYKRPARQSWQAFRASWEQEGLAGRARKTLAVCRQGLDAFERACHPGPLSGVDGRMVARFHAALIGHPYAPSTVSSYLGALQAALRWGQRVAKVIPEVPPFPVVRLVPGRPRPLPAEQYDRLLERAGQLAPLLALGWHAGLRISEAARLSWDEGSEPWVDLAARRIRFPVGSQKAKREDWIPVAPALMQVVQALRESAGGAGAGSRVVPLARKDGSPVLDSYRTDYAGKAFKVLAERAGVRCTFHSLRKSFCTRYAAKVPAQVLMRLARHSTIATTLQFYTDLSDALEKAVLDVATEEGVNRER